MKDDAVTRESTFAFAGPERYFTPRLNESFNPGDFTMIFLDSDSVTNVTRLNRINHRRVLLFIGNGKGMISYGMGKGDDYEQAFEDAYKVMRKNLVLISLDPKLTVTQVLYGRHNDYRIKIFPQMTPNYWGNPIIWQMLIHTGFFHCRFFVKSRKKDPYSLVYAYFTAVTQNRTEEELAEMRGTRLLQTTYGNATMSDKKFTH